MRLVRARVSVAGKESFVEIIGAVPVADEPVSFKAHRYLREGEPCYVVEDVVQGESLLAVYVNDILTMQLGCSASHLVARALGLTLICKARPDSMDVLYDPYRALESVAAVR